MNEHFISDELFTEIKLLPDPILMSCALDMRNRWLANPDDGEAILSFMIFSEVVISRNLCLPPIDDDAAFERAASRFAEMLTLDDCSICQ